MRLPNHGTEATGGTAERPAFREPDILHENFFNQVVYSLYHLLEQTGVAAAEEFDHSDVRTYERVYQAISEMINARAGVGQVGRLNLRIVDPSNLPTLAPNELVPMGQELNRADYPELWEYINASGAMVTDSVWNQPNREAFYSSGNGSTTFRPGNLVTGVFPRFLDLTGLYDPDRASRVGGNVAASWQGDAIRNITGKYEADRLSSYVDGVGTGAFRNATSSNRLHANSSSSATNQAFDFDASRVVQTGNDNRPVSIAILPTYIFEK